MVIGVDFLQERYAVSSGLSCSCLCQCDDIVADAEKVGDDLFLHGHGIFESHFCDGAANLFGDTKFFECFHLNNDLVFFIRIITK